MRLRHDGAGEMHPVHILSSTNVNALVCSGHCFCCGLREEFNSLANDIFYVTIACFLDVIPLTKRNLFDSNSASDTTLIAVDSEFKLAGCRDVLSAIFSTYIYKRALINAIYS